MKERTKYFLGPEKIDHDSEIFDYIVELHAYLWRYVRTVYPYANGKLSSYVDDALMALEKDTTRRGKVG